MERNHPHISIPKKSSMIRKVLFLFTLGIAVFTAIVFICISLFPQQVSKVQTLLTNGSQTDDRGVLGDFIAQIIPTTVPTAIPGPTAVPSATPLPPTLTPTPTLAPTPTPVPNYNLTGTIFNDLDQDRVKDTNESGIPNVVVTFTGQTTTTATTNASGVYTATIKKGDYTVSMAVPSGYKSTVTNPQVVALTANRTVNFGLVPTYSLTGSVFGDTDLSQARDATETGNAGLTVTVSGPTPANTTTDASGNFTFPQLTYGNYTITVTVPGGYKATTSNPRTITLTSNQTASFGLAQVFTVNGSLFLDNNRNTVDDTGDGNYVGGTVTFTGPVNTTARSGSDGSYSVQLFAGTYNATVALPSGYQASTALNTNFSIGPNTTINFGIIPLFTISGSLFEDRNEDGNRGSGDSIEKGITVNLSGPTTASTVSDSNGNFRFNNLYAGTYTVSYVLPAKKKNTTTTTQTITFTNPTSIGSTTGGSAPPPPPPSKSVEFGLVTLFNVVGKVFIDLNKNGLIDPSEPYYQGATVSLTKSTPVTRTTDVSGNYAFTDQGSGDYFIAMDTPTGYRSTNANALNFVLTADRTMNFGITASTTTKVGGQCSANGVDIVVVMDISGSMNQQAPSSGTTKRVAAQRAVTSFIDIVSANVKNAQYSLVIFSDSANFPNSPYTRIFQPLTTSAEEMKNAVSAIPSSDNTCVQCGIVLANQELSRSTRGAQKVVIVITDGATNQSITSGGMDGNVDAAENAAMTSAIEGVNTQNIIYQVIGIGEGGGDFDPIFMQQIADTNGGSFYNAPTASTLESIYQSIAEDIGTAIVNGKIYNDKNANKVYDTGDLPLPNWTVNAMASDLTVPITAQSNSNGDFTFTGLCTKEFEFSQITQSGWYQTTDNTTYQINVESGNTYNDINFGNATGNNISGNIVNDFNKDLNFASPDTLFTQGATILFSGPVNKTITTTTGTYNSGALPPGTYNVSLISPLTNGYRMTYPLNGPPPSFRVTTGGNCNTNGATGAICQ